MIFSIFQPYLRIYIELYVIRTQMMNFNDFGYIFEYFSKLCYNFYRKKEELIRFFKSKNINEVY